MTTTRTIPKDDVEPSPYKRVDFIAKYGGFLSAGKVGEIVYV